LILKYEWFEKSWKSSFLFPCTVFPSAIRPLKVIIYSHPANQKLIVAA